MKTRVAVVAASFVALAVPGVASAINPVNQPATAVGIGQREFHLSAYRKSAPAGPVKFNIRNMGQDTHNLVLKTPGGRRIDGPDVLSGRQATWTVKLTRPGTYKLLCTRAGHYKLGMKSKLVVTKKR